MPTYQYECKTCKTKQEVRQKMTDEPLVICSACGKPDLSKVLFAPQFQLKGSGWYVTDFRDKGKKPESETPAATTSEETKPSATPTPESTSTVEKSTKSADTSASSTTGKNSV